MSVMYKMLRHENVKYNPIAYDIKMSAFSHPTALWMDATPSSVVFDDASWDLFKINISKKAKENRRSKININTDKTPVRTAVRTARDMNIERIEFSQHEKIVRICRASYDIKKYKNFAEVKVNLSKVEADHVINILSGEMESTVYFWISY